MATQLTIVNSILEDLREDTVSSVADTSYSKLIAKFVNRAKEDMEDINHTWSCYVTSIDTTILADGTRDYDLTGTNDRSFLMRRFDDEEIPQAFDITSGTKGQLWDAPLKQIDETYDLDENQNTTTYPRIFAVKCDADGRGWTLRLLWGANNARTWRTYWYVPQDRLAIDGTDDSTEILLPRNPIESRAYFYALNERGEEMGEPNGLHALRSKEAISAALELDLQVQKKSYELDISNGEYL